MQRILPILLLLSYLLCLPVSTALVLAIKQKRYRISRKRQLILKSAVAEDVQNRFQSRNKKSMLQESMEGPGHVHNTPNSTWQSARIDITAMVVSAVIAYLTWQAKSQTLLEKMKEVLPSVRSSTTIEDIAVGDVKTSAEESIIVQTLEEGDDLPLLGQTVLLSIKIYYNGLLIKEFPGSKQLLEWKYGLDGEVFEKLNLRGLKEKVALGDMKFNARRKVLLPPSQAFGEVGLAPYVPPNASIAADVILVRP